MVRNETRCQEIQEELAKTKEELTQTKEEYTLIKNKWSADVKDYNNLLEQYKAKCASCNALEAQLSQTKREWTDKYNQLVKEYNTLLDNSKQTSQSTNSDLVKVRISYGCVNDLTGWQTNSWQRIEMPMAEYKALLNGSMKAREAYVKNKWLSSWQHAVNVTIALDE
jgi:DNA repair exonuclease SbcCD ATPase subunit